MDTPYISHSYMTYLMDMEEEEEEGERGRGGDLIIFSNPYNDDDGNSE